MQTCNMLVFALSIAKAIRFVRRKFMSCKSKITEIVEFFFVHTSIVYMKSIC